MPISDEVFAATFGGCATIVAALIVGIAGALISGYVSRKRDQQDRESQWRNHAIELTKLDIERKLRTRNAADTTPVRPAILDFLANYRDLQELGRISPKDLYLKIEDKRITWTAPGLAGPTSAEGPGVSPTPNS